MAYYTFDFPSYPYFLYAGDAIYRPGDSHRQRTNIGAFDLLMVQSGCLCMMDGDEYYDVNAGETLIIHPYQTHRSYKQCGEETYFHWLHFQTKEPFQFSSYPTIQEKQESDEDEGHRFILPAYQQLDDRDIPHVIKTLNDLESFRIDRYRTSSMVSKTSSAIVGHLQQQQLFLDLLSVIAVDRDLKPSDRSALIVMQYLKTNYAQYIKLSDVAELVHRHPTTLIRSFKSEYGVTPMKALNSIRIEKAKGLLLQTSLSCEAIAERVGFDSSSYFSKIFKKSTGLSPRAFKGSDD